MACGEYDKVSGKSILEKHYPDQVIFLFHHLVPKMLNDLFRFLGILLCDVPKLVLYDFGVKL